LNLNSHKSIPPLSDAAALPTFGSSLILLPPAS
jgi:hypothetical protein